MATASYVARIGLCGLLAACAPRQTSKGGLTPFAEAGATDSSVAGRRFALLVGADAYDDDHYPDLRYAGRDAQALAEALADYDEVTVLDTPETTTQASIGAALDGLAARADRSDDTVVVYFSGHGTLGRGDDGDLERFLVGSDADSRAIEATGWAVRDVVARLESMTAQRKGLILAACYNGREKSALTEALSAELASYKGGVPPLLQRSQALIVTSAASWGEAAIEDAGLEHDVYTAFLLEGLEEGDRDVDGAVTLTEAHDYARERTYAFTDGRQRPSARAVVLGRDPIVLAGDPSGAPPPLLYSYDANASGLTLLFDGQTKGELPGGIPVESGVHEIRLESEGTLVHRKRVRLEPGERVSLADLVRERTGWSVRLGGLGAVGFGPRDELRPAAAGPVVGVEWRHPRQPWNIALAAGAQQRGADEARPAFRSGALDLSVGMHLVDRPAVRAGPLLGVQASLTEWTQRFDFRSQAVGTVPSLGGRVAWLPGRNVELGLDARGGAWVGPEASGSWFAVPSASAGLTVGWSSR